MQYMHYALRIFPGLRTKRSRSALPATRVKREPVKHVPKYCIYLSLSLQLLRGENLFGCA
jgi:hypothetical protein